MKNIKVFMKMEEWNVLKRESIELGSNNFIEVSIKEHPESKAKLIGISKGWITNDGDKRYKSNIILGVDKKEELIKVLSEIEND